MIHALKCDCFDCKNGYTKPEDKAVYITRKFKKPTGKRPNRTNIKSKIIEVWKKDQDLYKEFLNRLERD